MGLFYKKDNTNSAIKQIHLYILFFMLVEQKTPVQQHAQIAKTFHGRKTN